MEETLAAFKRIYDAGKTKSVGVSNFSIDQVDRARAISQAPISVNQVEYHVRYNTEELLQHCTKYHIVLTAHCPLAKGTIGNEPILTTTASTIAEKHGKTSAQVALRWLIQKGLIAIPKASSESHLRENLNLFDWELTPEEMQQIDSVDRGSHTP